MPYGTRWSHEPYRMPLEIDITDTWFYQKGYAQGVAKARVETAFRMLEDGYLPIEKIAKFSGLTIDEVIAMRDNIGHKP